MERTDLGKKRGRPRKYATKEEARRANIKQTSDKVKESYNTKEGRAYFLSKNYERLDLEADRGLSTITPQFIKDHIFASKCYWCGETDWKQLGCDRIDNTKPHTPDNVLCSCSRCNIERNRHSMDYFKKYQVSKETQGVQLALF